MVRNTHTHTQVAHADSPAGRSSREADGAESCVWGELQPRLVGWIERHSRPPIDAEEIASETILRGLREFGSCPCWSRDRVLAWCRTTARHLVVDEVRRIRRRALVAGTALLQEAVTAPPAVGNEFARRVVVELKEGAGATERRVIELPLGGASNAELARELGVTLRTIERYRQSLRARAGAIRAAIHVATAPEPGS